MAVPGPPLLILLPLLLPLLLSKASLPAAAYTLTPGRQPQHKLLHLGKSKHIQKHTSKHFGKTHFFLFLCRDLKFFVVVSLLLDWPKDCGMAHFKPNMAERIVSGNEARPHSWPWQVSLQVNLYLNWRDGSGRSSVTPMHWLCENITYTALLQTHMHIWTKS